MSKEKSDVPRVFLRLNFSNMRTDTAPPKDFSRPATMCIGELQRLFSKRLDQPSLYLFVMNGSEGFVPMPDQTLGDLNLIHGKMDAQGVRSLSINLCPRVFQG